MHILDLPVELLNSVCNYVAFKELSALTRTHRILQPIAQRHLYCHVSIAPANGNLSVMRTLSTRVDVAEYLQSLTIRFDTFTTAFTRLYRYLPDILPRVAHLSALELFIDPKCSWVLQKIAKNTCSRLRRFSCNFPFDENLVQFLNTTESLEDLELEAVEKNVDPKLLAALSPHSLPRLARFNGCVRYAEIFVPGRPVTSISLTVGDVTDSVIATLAISTGHVDYLTTPCQSFTVPLLASIVQHFDKLVYLSVAPSLALVAAPSLVSLSAIAIIFHADI